MLRTGVAAAIFWMSMATLLNSLAGGMVRELSGEIPIIELVFFRNIVALVILAPWVMRRGIARLPATRLPLYGVRVLLAYAAMVMLFYALARMPIADVYALQYAIPRCTMRHHVSTSVRGFKHCHKGVVAVREPGSNYGLDQPLYDAVSLCADAVHLGITKLGPGSLGERHRYRQQHWRIQFHPCNSLGGRTNRSTFPVLTHDLRHCNWISDVCRTPRCLDLDWFGGNLRRVVLRCVA